MSEPAGPYVVPPSASAPVWWLVSVAVVIAAPGGVRVWWIVYDGARYIAGEVPGASWS